MYQTSMKHNQTYTKHIPNIYQTYTKHIPNIYQTYTKHKPNIYETCLYFLGSSRCQCDRNRKCDQTCLYQQNQTYLLYQVAMNSITCYNNVHSGCVITVHDKLHSFNLEILNTAHYSICFITPQQNS